MGHLFIYRSRFSKTKGARSFRRLSRRSHGSGSDALDDDMRALVGGVVFIATAVVIFSRKGRFSSIRAKSTTSNGLVKPDA